MDNVEFYDKISNIKLNKIKCLICGDIIESKSVYDLVSCKCELCYIDSGSYYAHIGANDFSKIVKLLDDKTEVVCN